MELAQARRASDDVPVASDERTRPELEDAARAAGRHVLIGFWEGGHARATLPRGGTLLIGRGDGCDLVIDHASVSRHHARLHADPAGALAVEDLGSMNGVRVGALGGEKIEKGARVAVPAGGQIHLGSAVVMLQSPPLPSGDLRAGLERTSPPVTASAELDRLLALVAPSDIAVLVLGETGVGKNVTAARLHAASARSHEPLVRINCAAFPEALLEAELFGYERGAFTGAVQSKPGLFETADGGTAFLDEIGDMPLATQAKLLGVLDSRETQRLGSVKPRRVDVRFVAATNRDLREEARAGTFRRDLYFRLSAVTLTVPALRDRRGDIAALARGLLGELGVSDVSLPPDVEELLVRYDWPGNVRELRNALERACVLAGGAPLAREHFDLRAEVERAPRVEHGEAPSAGPSSGNLRDEIASLERQRIVRALADCQGNQTRAAEILGISRRTLIHRMEEFGLPRPRKR
jgi:transcriptional regulator with AAA-type ATPase domain